MSNVSSAVHGAATSGAPAGKLDPLAQLLAGGDGLPLDFAALLAQAGVVDPDATAIASGEASNADATDAAHAAETTDPLTAAILALTGSGLPPALAALAAAPAQPVPTVAAAAGDAPTDENPGGLGAVGGKGRAQDFLATLQAQRSAPADAAGKDQPSGDAGEAGAVPVSVAKIAVPAGKADAAPPLAADAGAHPGGGNGPSAMSAVVPTHGIAPGAHPAAHAGTAAPLPVSVSLHDPRWASEVGQKIVWMARQDLQSAQLSVSPAHLGPIDITLNVGSDGTTALFHSANAEVRDMLEAALPRLREMMSQAGIQLSDARVGAQNQGQPDAQQHGERRFGANERGGNAILLSESAVNHDMRAGGRAPAGLVDLFA